MTRERKTILSCEEGEVIIDLREENSLLRLERFQLLKEVCTLKEELLRCEEAFDEFRTQKDLEIILLTTALNRATLSLNQMKEIHSHKFEKIRRQYEELICKYSHLSQEILAQEERHRISILKLKSDFQFVMDRIGKKSRQISEGDDRPEGCHFKKKNEGISNFSSSNL